MIGFTLENFFYFMSGMCAGGILIMVLHHMRPVTRFDRVASKRKNEAKTT